MRVCLFAHLHVRTGQQLTLFKPRSPPLVSATDNPVGAPTPTEEAYCCAIEELAVRNDLAGSRILLAMGGSKQTLARMARRPVNLALGGELATIDLRARCCVQ